jgi:predicted Rossmann fold nucleotide-binding protein DprA/Smf involved in DNA uptake
LLEHLVANLGDAARRVALVDATADLTADERRVFDLLSWDPAHVDEITVRSSVKPDRLAELLLGLELKGVAKRVPGHRYVRQVTAQ